MRRIKKLGLEMGLHETRLVGLRESQNSLSMRVEHLENAAVTEFQLALLQEKIDLLYDYLKLKVRFHPPMKDIAKRGQKKR